MLSIYDMNPTIMPLPKMPPTVKIRKKAGSCKEVGTMLDEKANVGGITISPAVIMRSHRTPYFSPICPHSVLETTPLNAEHTMKGPMVASETPSSFSA